MQSSSFETKKEQYQKLKESLRCHLCKRLPRPHTKVFKCSENLPICESCFDGMEKCCHCIFGDRDLFTKRQYDPELRRDDYYRERCDRYHDFRYAECKGVQECKSMRRCNLTENLILDLPVECKNTRFGCDQILPIEKYSDHEKICIFRQVYCAEFGCLEKVGYLDYLEHFEKIHPNNSEKNFQESVELPINFENLLTQRFILPTKLSTLNRTFFDVVTVKNGFIYCWIYALDDEIQTKHFRVEAKIKGNDGYQINFNLGVNSMNSNMDDILKSEENVFCFSLKAAKNFVNDGILDFSLKIRNLKEEAKDKDVESGISDNDE